MFHPSLKRTSTLKQSCGFEQLKFACVPTLAIDKRIFGCLFVAKQTLSFNSRRCLFLTTNMKKEPTSVQGVRLHRIISQMREHREVDIPYVQPFIRYPFVPEKTYPINNITYWALASRAEPCCVTYAAWWTVHIVGGKQALVCIFCMSAVLPIHYRQIRCIHPGIHGSYKSPIQQKPTSSSVSPFLFLCRLLYWCLAT